MRANTEECFVFICNSKGIIQNITRNQLEIFSDAKIGDKLEVFLDEGSREKFLQFLSEVIRKKGTYKWELYAKNNKAVVPIHIGGIQVSDDEIILIGGKDNKSLDDNFFYEFTKINNEQLNQLREAIKEKNSFGQDSLHSKNDVYQRLIRLTNELAANKRELTKQNKLLEVELGKREEVERQLSQSSHALEERVKELNCLYNVASYLSSDEPLPVILQKIADIVPPSLQYPEISRCRLTIDTEEYTSSDFTTSDWVLSQDIVVDNLTVGKIEFFYTENMGTIDEDPWMNEERALINSLANKIAHQIELIKVNTDLKSTQKILTIKNQIANVFLTSSPEELFADVLECVLDAMESRFGFFGYINSNGDLVCPSMTRDIFEKCQVPDKDIVFPKDNWGGMWGDSLSSKVTLMKNDGLFAPQGHVELNRAITCPIVYKDELLGMVAVANKESDYSKNDINLLETIIISIAPILYLRLSKEEEEKRKKRSEEALVKSENMYREVVEGTDDLITQVNGKGEFTYVNHTSKEIYGYSPQELIGKLAFDFIFEEDREQTIEDFQTWLKEKRTNIAYENRQVHRNGSLRSISWSINLHYNDQGELDYINSIGQDITESKIAKLELETLVEEKTRDLQIAYNSLRESDERHRALVETSFDWIWEVDRNNHFTYGKANIKDFIGYSVFDILGKKPYDIVHPEEREELIEKMKGITKGQLPFENIINRYIHRDGSIVYLEVSGKPYYDPNGTLAGYRGFAKNITDNITSQEKLAQSQKRYRDVFDNSTEGIGVLQNGHIRFLNASLGRILGYSKKQIIQRAFEQFIHPEERDNIMKKLDKILAGKISNTTSSFRIVNSKGNYRHIRASSVKIIWEEQPGIIIFISDVTEKVLAEIEAEKQRKHLIQTDKLTSLGTLVAGVAHEINNPNNFILLGIQAMEELWDSAREAIEIYIDENGPLMPDGSEYLKLKKRITKLNTGIFESSVRIRDLVSSLKDFARQGSKDLGQSVNINKVIEAAVLLVQNKIKNSTNSFTVDYAEDLPLVMGNFNRLVQVVVNLIQNSAESLNDLSDSIKITTSISADGNSVEIITCDTGSGIPEDILPNIMDPFFTTKRDTGGTGLGLSVSAGIINDHKGKLLVESKAGKGTTARVLLPLNLDGQSKNDI